VLLLRRISNALLCLVLFAGNAAVCAGWTPSPEARMACCAEGNSCPMHKHESHDSASVTQLDADRCCAATEGHSSSSPSAQSSAPAISLAVLGEGILLPADVPQLAVEHDDWTSAPLPSSTPTHVLLSVFLI
jgi:hypothetical protein